MMKLAVLLLCCAVLSGCSLSLQGDNGLTVAGNSSSDTVTLVLDGTVAREIGTDSGMAVPGSNTFYILGSGNVTTAGSGNTVTISYEGGDAGNATYALDSDKLDGEHGSFYLTPTGTSAVKVYRSSAQTLTKGIWNKVKCNTELYDVLGEYDNVTGYRFTVTVAGYYFLAGSLDLDQTVLYKEVSVCVSAGQPGTATIYAQGKVVTPASLYPVVFTSTVQYLAVGDKVELWGYEGDTVDRAIAYVNGTTSLTVVRLW
jgi:hypothetical protein